MLSVPEKEDSGLSTLGSQHQHWRARPEQAGNRPACSPIVLKASLALSGTQFFRYCSGLACALDLTWLLCDLQGRHHHSQSLGCSHLLWHWTKNGDILVLLNRYAIVASLELSCLAERRRLTKCPMQAGSGEDLSPGLPWGSRGFLVMDLAKFWCQCLVLYFPKWKITYAHDKIFRQHGRMFHKNI